MVRPDDQRPGASVRSAIDGADAAGIAIRKARRHQIPFLFLLYIVAYLDRINVGFAALQMNEAIGLSATAYSIGAGIFFVSYAIFEVPSNVILARIGARRWIARIMISWGIVSSAMMFVRGPASFYALRFLLGAAEAGFFPGIIFYLTRWFPARERARTIALFMTAVLVAGIVGSPISGALLSVSGAGLAGWQWLFLIEGVPSVVLGFVVLRTLTERPQDASWLSERERAALASCLEEDARVSGAGHGTIARAMTSGRVWWISAVHFTIPVALYGIGFFLPLIIKNASHGSDFQVGLLSAIPYAAGAAAMVVSGRHSDRTGERRKHVAVAALVCAAGLIAAAGVTGPVGSVMALSVAMAGLASMMGPFWALATAGTSGVGGAAAIALINSVGNTGGFAGPYLLGAVNDATHSFAAGLAIIAGIVVVGGSLILALREPGATPP